MKMKVLRPVALLLLFCQMLTSCYTYKNLVKSENPTPANYAEKITIGNRYKVKLQSGQEHLLDATQVDAQHLYGTAYTTSHSGQKLENPITVPLDQIISLKERKRDDVLLLGIILAAAALVVYYFAEHYTMFSADFLNGSL